MDEAEAEAAIAGLTGRQMREGLAAIAASRSASSPFARIAAAMHSPPHRAAMTASRILAAGAASRGEPIDLSRTVAGPSQARHVASAAEILAAGKLRRGEAL